MRWLGVVMWLGMGCAPEQAAPQEVLETGAQAQDVECSKLTEVSCVREHGLCPRVAWDEVCTITIGMGAEPVTPAKSCIHRKQWLKLRLDPDVSHAIIHFDGDPSGRLFEGDPTDLVKLDPWERPSWCGKVSGRAQGKGYPFKVSSDTGEGQPGELEVVRDPGEPEEE
ncbi:hypothetical protein ACN47A_07280 [Myxococcus fulvus]|uniref:hypothetical protein n=1 Tax=Myxococcus fulvus TaxID=33 RepID=UPI003B9CE671